MKSKILLMDDDPAVRRMLSRVLEDEAYTVFGATNASEALEVASTRDVDLAMVDLNLPDETGWDLFERLIREHPLLPIVVVTARANQLFPALAAGVGALMEKPLDLPRLLSTIRDLLKERAEARRARLGGQPAQFHYLPARG
jgi:two-component system KDP operon response regulator KdpE